MTLKQSNATPGALLLILLKHVAFVCMRNVHGYIRIYCGIFTKKDAGGERSMQAVYEKLTLMDC